MQSKQQYCEQNLLHNTLLMSHDLHCASPRYRECCMHSTTANALHRTNGQVISHYRPITIVEQHQCQHNSALPRTRHTAPAATTVSTCQALSGYQLAARQLSTTAMARNSIATFTASFLVKPAVSRSTASLAQASLAGAGSTVTRCNTIGGSV